MASRYSTELRTACDAALKAGAFIRSRAGGMSGTPIRDKGTHDLVTNVDEEAERIVRACLLESFPDDDILGEESAPLKIAPASTRRRWIVDPLDGTTNFIHGIPPYAVSIAFQDGADLVAGVVYDIPHDELFAAELGAGLVVNGKSARVSKTADLEQAVVATGFPFREYDYADAYLSVLGDVMRSARGVRRHGAAAVDLAWVSCGRFDAFFECGLAPWDTAAGVVLVRSAGGQVVGLPSGSDPVFDGGILACNAHVIGDLDAITSPLASAYAGHLRSKRASQVDGRDQTEGERVLTRAALNTAGNRPI